MRKSTPFLYQEIAESLRRIVAGELQAVAALVRGDFAYSTGQAIMVE